MLGKEGTTGFWQFGGEKQNIMGASGMGQWLSRVEGGSLLPLSFSL